MGKTILVFGLPGVGKTTLINDFVGSTNNCIRLSGGSLIQEQIAEEDRDRLRELKKDQIISNQEILVFNFKKKKKKLMGQHILFDGHCAVKTDNQLIEVPLYIIRDLDADMMVFIDEDSNIILDRRSKDENRPGRDDETLEALNENREIQLSICKKYSEELNIPLEIISSPSIEKLSSVISIPILRASL